MGSNVPRAAVVYKAGSRLNLLARLCRDVIKCLLVQRQLGRSLHARRNVILPISRELSHGIWQDVQQQDLWQAVVCRRLPRVRSAVIEHWNTQCARRRSKLSHVRGHANRQTAMHQRLSCALSRLPAHEPVAVGRVPGCLPGLHPIHLYGFRTGLTQLRVAAISGAASAHLYSRLCSPAPAKARGLIG
jgi:hypothetical protein